MSSITPQSLEGSQAPSQLEVFWEKNRRKLTAVLWLPIAAIGVNEGYKWYRQKQIDEIWGKFAATAYLTSGYAPTYAIGNDSLMKAQVQLASDLARVLGVDTEQSLATAAANADSSQRPFLLWLQAYSAYRAKDWAKAETALDQLKDDFPKHVLVVESDYPVQFRGEVKQDEADKKPNKTPEMKPAAKGSAVSRLREQIAAEKAFQLPARFAKPQIPADAPKFAIKFKGRDQTVVLAMMSAEAPEHCKKFQALVDKKNWDGERVDELRRPGNSFRAQGAPMMLHFGYTTTRGEEDRTKWRDTKPSEEQVDYEVNNLSHFEGAVSCQMEKDKSSVDRIWISVSDNPAEDQDTVVFAYVVEGLDLLKQLAQLPLTNQQEEDAGRGTPTENIEIESVSKVQ